MNAEQRQTAGDPWANPTDFSSDGNKTKMLRPRPKPKPKL